MQLVRGRVPDLASDEAKDDALHASLDDIYAASSQKTVKSRRRCYTRLLSLWGALLGLWM